MKLKYSKIKEVYNPSLAYDDPAGIDIYIPNTAIRVELRPGQNVLIPTGLKLNIPKGYYVEVKNRSSIANKQQLMVGACVIDNDYQGEVFVDIHNVGLSHRYISAGDKIAQLVLHKKHNLQLEEVSEDELYSEVSLRGDGSLGSSN